MPLYSAQTNPLYQPAIRDILSISNANPALITTTFDGINPGNHLYKNGLIVRITIPQGFGMAPFNTDATFPIIVTSPTTFTIPLDTTNMNVFIIPTVYPNFYLDPAQSVVVGEVSQNLDQSVHNSLQN